MNIFRYILPKVKEGFASCLLMDKLAVYWFKCWMFIFPTETGGEREVEEEEEEEERGEWPFTNSHTYTQKLLSTVSRISEENVAQSACYSMRFF